MQNTKEIITFKEVAEYTINQNTDNLHQQNHTSHPHASKGWTIIFHLLRVGCPYNLPSKEYSMKRGIARVTLTWRNLTKTASAE